MLVPVRGLVLIPLRWLSGGRMRLRRRRVGRRCTAGKRFRPSDRDRLPNQLPLYGPQPVKTRKFGRIIRTQ